MSIWSKIPQAIEAQLDAAISKAKTAGSTPADADEAEERKSTVDLYYPEQEQYGWKEKTSVVGNGVLKNMGRKDSVIRAIINTRLAQITPFTKEQEDRYNPGWCIQPVEVADITDEDKLKLSDPALDEKAYEQLKHEMDEKRVKIKQAQDKEIEKIKLFVKHCGMAPEETDTTHRRWDFTKYVKSVLEDLLIYNYTATELVPTKGGDKVHHFYPVSAGTIKYVSGASSEKYMSMIQPILEARRADKRFDASKPFKYVQVVRGRIVAAFTEDELIFEPTYPTTDPEDNGYAIGPLEMLVQIVTAHLYAEAHNRNFFTQGIGSKGILHIKGDNISRAQLEAFKRQWFNQVVNSRNAFRPPIIGMADEVRWVALAGTNKDMEFDNWMNYLIKICCAIYQIDPAEINFDISKVNTSTLNEASSDEKMKASKDKGMRPLLDYMEDIINNHILRYWDPKLADKYKFKFCGFQTESKTQEIDRLEKEVRVFRTLNEARIYMGLPPIENGDVVLNATYTQYLAQKQQQQQAEDAAMNPEDPEGGPDGEEPQEEDQGVSPDLDSLSSDVSQAIAEAEQESNDKSKAEEKKAADEAKKSEAAIAVEYYIEK